MCIARPAGAKHCDSAPGQIVGVTPMEEADATGENIRDTKTTDRDIPSALILFILNLL